MATMAKKTSFKHTKKRYLIGVILSTLMLLTTFLAAWQLPQTRELFGQASGTPAAIIIYTQSFLGPLPRPWRNLSQGGEDHAWRLKPVADSIGALNPEYIRLDHIYDFYDVVGGTSGNLTFNFSKLDLVLSDIAEVGAKPYISLSYMPTVLNATDLTGAPDSYRDWQVVVEKTIEHISGTRGTENVYYEVWNEPDLFGGWKYYGKKNYLDLYTASAQGAQAVRSRVKPFKLGGAATTALYENWFNALATHVTTNNLRFDFFSWHRYSTNLDLFNEDLQNVQRWVAQYPQLDGQIEYHISEWGHDSDNDVEYDTQAGAAHTVAGAISLINPLVKSFVFEVQDGKDPNGKASWGRWGLLQHGEFGSKPKPRYWGLRLLDKLPEQRLQLTGQGTWVKGVAATTPEGSEISAVLANYDASGTHSETVPITFADVAPGAYVLTATFLTGNTVELHSTAEENIVTFSLFLPPQSVAYLTLTPS
jgi:hypothetical protein